MTQAQLNRRITLFVVFYIVEFAVGVFATTYFGCKWVEHKQKEAIYTYCPQAQEQI